MPPAAPAKMEAVRRCPPAAVRVNSHRRVPARRPRMIRVIHPAQPLAAKVGRAAATAIRLDAIVKRRAPSPRRPSSGMTWRISLVDIEFCMF